MATRYYASFGAHVTHEESGKKKCPVNSYIGIFCGPVCVAEATLGGEYSWEQAYEEFAKDCSLPDDKRRFIWTKQGRTGDWVYIYDLIPAKQSIESVAA